MGNIGDGNKQAPAFLQAFAPDSVVEVARIRTIDGYQLQITHIVSSFGGLLINDG